MNRRITNTVLIILLLLNAAFIGSWWIGHWKMHHPHSGMDHFTDGEDKGMGFLSKQLGLDSIQKKQVEGLWNEHMAKMGKYETEISRFEKQTLDCMTQDAPDSTRAFAYADSAGMVRNAMHKELFRHFTKIKSLCNAEQKKKFDDVLKNMMTKFSHHHMHPDAMNHDSM